ncbi:two-component system sensor histidine kinase RppB [Gloeocapsa sp. PCC 73106]|uniref:two-component system sensor histidine kinase RppB n=1 Tax=Gloeocapsa sp. PCC 73106 TaxID=102232 RepID=UPI0002AC7A2C|nr:two-component system sensor histidine kinase RppB [Gloeocapsa sp. PCC 73106]ELR96236.1 histidine kinase [Gloeocapsa sp. PCC 73106]
MTNQLFRQTRWRLGSWYASIISVILGVLGWGVYEAIVHAHQITVEQELTVVAQTIHNSLEPILKTPGKLDEAVERLLPNFCTVNKPCELKHDTYLSQYYLRLFNLETELIAIAGTRIDSSIFSFNQEKIFIDNRNNRYLQIIYTLHTQDGKEWGYLLVGRSLKDFDAYLRRVGWILLLGLPVIIILVTLTAWWLAGLAMKPIHRSYQQIQQFTSDAAHELRTPLAALRATLEATLMLPNLSEKEIRETLETLQRQQLRLADLVADLLLLSRLDWDGKDKALASSRLECVCLNDLLSDLVEELGALALASEITLSYQCPFNQLVIIKGDPEKIYRLVFNLVVNGIENTPKQGKVSLELTQNKDRAVIRVRDTGVGIAKTEQPYIFDRFYRVNKARTRNKGGSGLGLAIAQAIAFSHQGTIKVESALGEGSIFTVSLGQIVDRED